MISFETAKQIALKENKNINTVEERQSAWVFYDEAEEGDDAETVVMKKDGTIVTFFEYIINTKDDKKKKRRFKI